MLSFFIPFYPYALNEVSLKYSTRSEPTCVCNSSLKKNELDSFWNSKAAKFRIIFFFKESLEEESSKVFVWCSLGGDFFNCTIGEVPQNCNG